MKDVEYEIMINVKKEDAAVIIDGTWDGTLYLEKLNQYIRGEKIKITFSNDGNSKISAQITEKKQKKGLKQSEDYEEIIYSITGEIDKGEENLHLVGKTPNGAGEQETEVRIKLKINQDKQSMKGTYCIGKSDNLCATIELYKI